MIFRCNAGKNVSNQSNYPGHFEPYFTDCLLHEFIKKINAPTPPCQSLNLNTSELLYIAKYFSVR